MLNRSKRLQRIARDAVLAAGLLACSVMAANAQARMSADEQVRAAQEASEKAVKAKPQPTSLVLMNGVLVEMPIAVADSTSAPDNMGLNQPSARAAAASQPVRSTPRVCTVAAPCPDSDGTSPAVSIPTARPTLPMGTPRPDSDGGLPAAIPTTARPPAPPAGSPRPDYDVPQKP
jgi:hypothetical protein